MGAFRVDLEGRFTLSKDMNSRGRERFRRRELGTWVRSFQPRIQLRNSW
jgi:hypothetical protein